MCGRARQVLDWQELRVEWWTGQTALNLEPRWNAAPRQRLLIVRKRAGAHGAEALPMEWGFVPSWEKDPKRARRPINAMAETVATNGFWREAWKQRRCLFPVSAFYEWQPRGKAKIPYSIGRRDGRSMGLGALWDEWADRATGQTLTSFAVITCPANELVAEIHDRMPVVLDPADYATWLDGSPEAAAGVLRPFPAAELTAYRVSDRVGDVRNNTPDLAERVADLTTLL